MTRRAPRTAPFIFALLLAIIVAAGIPASLRAAPDATDVLVYKDGDRVQGRFISDDGKTIVFRSNRFGELSVPSSQAEVIYGSIPATAPANVGYAAAERHFSQARLNPELLMVEADHDLRNPTDMILLERVAKDVEEVGKIESMPKVEGRQMVMMVGPAK